MSTSFISKVNIWLKNVQYCLLPGTCIVCNRDSGRCLDLCRKCEISLPRIERPCECCGLPLAPGTGSPHCGSCILHPPPFRYIVSAFDYAEPVDGLITAFKYGGKLAHGRVLAEYLHRKIMTFYRDGPLPELLVPMPLHHARLRQRGFNQAVEIAALLSHRFDIPLTRTRCYRQRNTAKQEGLNLQQRKSNLRGAFSLKAGSEPLPSRVAIVDDVVTSTASTRELSGTLRRAGVQEVHIWSLARVCRKF